MIDGQETNEILYSSLALGHHCPLESIERIEIIRGPGSAIYGGYAELGVITLITKSAAAVNGVSVATSYGQMARAYAARKLSASFGKEIKDFSFVGHRNWRHLSQPSTACWRGGLDVRWKRWYA